MLFGGEAPGRCPRTKELAAESVNLLEHEVCSQDGSQARGGQGPSSTHRGDGTTGQVDVLHGCKAGACLCARRRGLEVMPLPCIRLSSLLIISVEAREELKVNNETGYLISTTIKC